MSTPSPEKQIVPVSVRPLRERDLVEARRIFRLAFGTFIGFPNPEEFWLDREYIFTRWRSDPDSGLAAEMDGQMVGSNFVSIWGSLGVLGPLTVRPEWWNQRIAQALLAATMDLFAARGVREAGLFTFAHSARHVGLYQKFGFWPGFLTALMSKRPAVESAAAFRFSALAEKDRQSALQACRKLTGSIYDGLDVSCEILGVARQNLGDTLLLWSGDSLDALAVCHCGEGTEAGKDTCYIKFAAAQPGPRASHLFDRLLDACESLAIERGLPRLQAGVNTGRRNAYRQMLQRGFRTDNQGVAMHRPDSPAYNRPDIFVVDDWR